MTTPPKYLLRATLTVAALLALLAMSVQGHLKSAEDPVAVGDSERAESSPSAETLAAWETIYSVLQHPRCLNCHPAGNAPLQGSPARRHAQNVMRGSDGKGRFAMRCATCHQDHNIAGEHMPPGAPHWQLPGPDMPLVFEGRSSAELCRQLLDPDQNGGKTPEQLYEHVAHDPLVLWGWNPGEGREPVVTPHADVVNAMRTWIDGGCGCPE